MINKKGQIFDMDLEYVIIIILAVISVTCLALLVYNNSKDDNAITQEKCYNTLMDNLITLKANFTCPTGLRVFNNNVTNPIQYYIYCKNNDKVSSNITIFLDKKEIDEKNNTKFILYYLEGTNIRNLTLGTKDVVITNKTVKA